MVPKLQRYYRNFKYGTDIRSTMIITNSYNNVNQSNTLLAQKKGNKIHKDRASFLA